jgi:phytoene dehydrogenase-like protein
MKQVVVIGAGHNGLVAAFYLAKRGLKPVVLERRPEVGGGAITVEIHRGFFGPMLSHECRLDQEIVREMQLERHGLELLRADPHLFAPAGDSEPLVLNQVHSGTNGARGIGTRDIEALGAFRSAISRAASVVGPLFRAVPPDIDDPAARDLLNLLKAGKRFRDLGKRDGYRLLRWLSMPVSDLVDEWFDSSLLRAAIAAPALSGTMLGPRSAGSGLTLLLREAHEQLAGGPMYVRGGPGALTRALAAAARDAGAEIRTAAGVDQILVDNERVRGVVSAGREIPATLVVSAVDPRTTFLSLTNPADLTPDFNAKIRNYRSAGTVAKINLALAALPSFGVSDNVLSGRIHIGPDIDYLERAFDHAKYGELSAEPWLDVRIPSILQPNLAPAGAHVASIYVHYAPRRLRTSDWERSSGPLLDRTLNVLERYAPGLRLQIVEAQVITPADLERDHGFHGGHIFHGELTLDQLFTMRPLLGFARYRSPIAGLYLCGAGTHPGGFMSGTSGRLAVREIVRSRGI